MDKSADPILSTQVMDSVKLIQGITDPSVIQEVVTQLMDNALFKDTLLSSLGITNLHRQVTSLEARIDDMEQYSRRTCLKFRGIPENSNEGSYENTDDIILNQWVLHRMTKPKMQTLKDSARQRGYKEKTKKRLDVLCMQHRNSLHNLGLHPEVLHQKGY